MLHGDGFEDGHRVLHVECDGIGRRFDVVGFVCLDCSCVLAANNLDKLRLIVLTKSQRRAKGFLIVRRG